MRKSQSQYLNLIVKKILQDKLSNSEIECFNILKKSIDPSGELEFELTHAWRLAEDKRMADYSPSKMQFMERGKFYLKRIFNNVRKKKFFIPVIYEKVVTIN